MASKSSRWSLTSLFKRKPESKSSSGTWTKLNQAPVATNPYHAVSVIPGQGSCAAAHRFTGQRFLSRQAPKLPLPTCDAARCTCRFKHHQDRRAGPRRGSEIGMMQAYWNGAEKRRTGGRRADDH
jgi:hypothetical protein